MRTLKRSASWSCPPSFRLWYRSNMARSTASDSPIDYVPYEKAYEEGFEDMRRRVPDLSKIREATGYEPQVRLPELLERVVADFEK